VLAEMKPLQDKVEPVEKQMNQLRQKWAGESYLGRVGKWIEPAVEPLGWDWRVGVAAVASFPAREVMVGTLGLVFSQGKGEATDPAFQRGLGETLRTEERSGVAGVPLFNTAVALSVMVFFALCCQCASTLAVIKRETNSWGWPVFTFVYMTALAYVGALVTYQVGQLFL
jgi:ferrous iron transport protein B